MMAGMYLGELVRHILRDLCERGIVFTKDALTVLNQRGSRFEILKQKKIFFLSDSFDTQMVSQIVENQPRHFSGIQNILALSEIGAIRKDCEIVHMVCDAVSRSDFVYNIK